MDTNLSPENPPAHQLSPTSGPQGIACYQLTHESGAEATFAQHGGHLISWKTADGQERLYLSETADYGTGKAIRGGVPVIFPQFSDHGPLGRHGFARKAEWEANLESGTLKLQTTTSSQPEWPYETALEIGVVLGNSDLQIQMTVQNLGSKSFEFHAALHTYLQVSNVETSVVRGLAGREFVNEVTKQRETDPKAEITFGEEIDRGYFGAGSQEVILADEAVNLRITSEHFPDLVVWNPGPEHGIGDMPTDDWRRFVCIEPAQVESRRTLAPGETWTGIQQIEVMNR
tara:strand:+ start:1670 stop:2530 length:861 start_codon:yes stop_codon:yes gene_type:complete